MNDPITLDEILEFGDRSELEKEFYRKRLWENEDWKAAHNFSGYQTHEILAVIRSISGEVKPEAEEVKRKNK